MDAVYGCVSDALAIVPPGAVQVSPLIPGSVAFEHVEPASLASLLMLAPAGAVERSHAIATGLRALQPGAPFCILAPKNRGGARIQQDLLQLGCHSDSTAKHHHRVCRGIRSANLGSLDAAIEAGAPRLVEALEVWSQPGIFSWDRIDPGSALLMAHLPALAGIGADLGCGVGLLARAVLMMPKVDHITLVDIDRRAVEAARRNVDAERSTVLWLDLADDAQATAVGRAPGTLDFCVMNPPFHDQLTENVELGRIFIKRAANLLRPGGLCVMTANRHLPYEAALKPAFSTVETVVQANGYKIIAARK
jgi:16S rRNA (guanine1207-N2)-methyltransferase